MKRRAKVRGWADEQAVELDAGNGKCGRVLGNEGTSKELVCSETDVMCGKAACGWKRRWARAMTKI